MACTKPSLTSVLIVDVDRPAVRVCSKVRISPVPGKTLYCSFCRKSQHEVKEVISGPFAVFVRDECVGLCNEIICSRYAEPFEILLTEGCRRNACWRSCSRGRTRCKARGASATSGRLSCGSARSAAAASEQPLRSFPPVQRRSGFSERIAAYAVDQVTLRAYSRPPNFHVLLLTAAGARSSM
jgi:hypothetical protein